MIRSLTKAFTAVGPRWEVNRTWPGMATKLWVGISGTLPGVTMRMGTGCGTGQPAAMDIRTWGLGSEPDPAPHCRNSRSGAEPGFGSWPTPLCPSGPLHGWRQAAVMGSGSLR